MIDALTTIFGLIILGVMVYIYHKTVDNDNNKKGE